jgi:hypothetical protein
MRRVIASVGAVVLFALVPACGGSGGEPAAEEAVGTASQAEFDPGLFQLLQGGNEVASLWRGTNALGLQVEYWALLPSYAASSSRSFSTESMTCSEWQSTVCGSGWSGATYLQANFTETTLDCAFPPGPCSAPRGARSVLGAGSYLTDDGSGSAIAWTYVAGSCEYWAMDSLVGNGAVQGPTRSGWSSLSAFETSMCGKSPVPSTWFTVYYTTVSDFCSAEIC